MIISAHEACGKIFLINLLLLFSHCFVPYIITQASTLL